MNVMRAYYRPGLAMGSAEELAVKHMRQWLKQLMLILPTHKPSISSSTSMTDTNAFILNRSLIIFDILCMGKLFLQN